MYLEDLTGVVHQKHYQVLALAPCEFMTLDDGFLKSAADQGPVVNLKGHTAKRNTTQSITILDSALKIKPDMLPRKRAQQG